MCNDTVSKTYLFNRMFPLDDTVVALFDAVEGKYHQCLIDNLCNSATCFKAFYNHKVKGLNHGVYKERNYIHLAMH